MRDRFLTPGRAQVVGSPLSQAKLVDAILPTGILSESKSNLIQ